MHSSLIGKIQKAHLYAEEPDRIAIDEFSATFRGDHSSYLVTYREDCRVRYKITAWRKTQRL